MPEDADTIILVEFVETTLASEKNNTCHTKIGSKYGITIVSANKKFHETMVPCRDGDHKDLCYLESAEPACSSEEDPCCCDPIANVTVHNVECGMADPPGGKDDPENGTTCVAGNLDKRPKEDVSCTTCVTCPVLASGPETEKEMYDVSSKNVRSPKNALLECTRIESPKSPRGKNVSNAPCDHHEATIATTFESKFVTGRV